MLADIFKDLIAEFSIIFQAIVGVIAVAVSLAIALFAVKKYRIAIFLKDPDSSEKFKQFYQLNSYNYESKDQAAKDYLAKVKLAHQYEYLYGRQERARTLYYERRDAYRYLKSMDKMNYRGFDDDLDDNLDDGEHE